MDNVIVSKKNVNANFNGFFKGVFNRFTFFREHILEGGLKGFVIIFFEKIVQKTN